MEKWFSKRREDKVLNMANRAVTLAIGTVTELEVSINAVMKGNNAEVQSAFERLSLAEHEIDELRRAVFEELTKGVMPPKDREDIMHLVKRLDEMADHVKDSARNITILSTAKVLKEIWKQFEETSKDLVKCATILRNAIEKLGTDPAEAKELSKKVDEVEGLVDEKYLKTKGMLLEHSDEMNAATLLLLAELNESLERIADACDDTADYVRILAVSRETE